MTANESNTENLTFCIDLGRPLDKGPLIRGSLEPLSVIKCEISFMDVSKDIRDELYNEVENFKATLQGMACQWRYLKLKETLKANLDRIPEKELKSKYSKACKRIMREMAELEKQMEAAKLPQEETASNRPDFVGEPNIKLKEDVEEFLAMSQEKFEEMVQNYLKSAPRCKFAEGNSSNPTGESFTAEGMKMPKEEPAKPKKHPYDIDILMNLSTEVPSILVKAAMEILVVSTQPEYVELATELLNDALKYDSLNSHARGYDESVSNAAKALRNRGEESSQEAAV